MKIESLHFSETNQNSRNLEFWIWNKSSILLVKIIAWSSCSNRQGWEGTEDFFPCLIWPDISSYWLKCHFQWKVGVLSNQIFTKEKCSHKLLFRLFSWLSLGLSDRLCPFLLSALVTGREKSPAVIHLLVPSLKAAESLWQLAVAWPWWKTWAWRWGAEVTWSAGRQTLVFSRMNMLHWVGN